MLEKTLESPLDCKEIQPVHPKGDQSWVFIEGLMLKLKLQYFAHLMRQTDSLEKTLMLGKIEGRRRRGRQRMRWLDGIADTMELSLSRLQEINKIWYRNKQNIFYGIKYVQDREASLVCCCLWGSKESDKTEQLNNNN